MTSDSTPASTAPQSKLAERIQMTANVAVILACVGVAWLAAHQEKEVLTVLGLSAPN